MRIQLPHPQHLFSLPGQLVGEKFIKHDTKAVQVRLRCDLFIGMLFRRGIRRRPAAGMQGQCGPRNDARKAKIRQIGVALNIHQDIRRFYIPVNDALGV